MRRATVLFLVAISCLTNGCWQGTGQDGDPDTSTDADVDVDGDTDVDTDVDADADTDGDSDSDMDTDTSTMTTPGWEKAWQSDEGCLYSMWGIDDENNVAVGASSGWAGYLLRLNDGEWEGMEGSFPMLSEIWFEDINKLYVGTTMGGHLFWGNDDGWLSDELGGNNDDGPTRIWADSGSGFFILTGASLWQLNTENESLIEIGGPSTFLNISIWGFAPEQLFVGTHDGGIREIWKYVNGNWFSMESGLEQVPYGLWGSSPDDLFVVAGGSDGWESEIKHFNGESWEEMFAPTNSALNSVFGFGPDDVYAVGWWGTILHYDGAEWTQMESGTDIHLWDIWGASPDSVWVVGGTISPVEGVVLHYMAE
jgi:hypothetical protein